MIKKKIKVGGLFLHQCVGYIPLTESTQHNILNFIERQKTI